MHEDSDWLPLSPFLFQDQRFTVRGVSGTPSTGRASCSCGTSPLIREASPSANIHGPHYVSMPHPSTVKAHIGSILRLVACSTGWALLRGIGRVNHLHANTQVLSLACDELGQLVEGPCILHAVVFACRGTTTFTCRTLPDAGEGFHFDDANTLLMSMIDDLPG